MKWTVRLSLRYEGGARRFNHFYVPEGVRNNFWRSSITRLYFIRCMIEDWNFGAQE